MTRRRLLAFAASALCACATVAIGLGAARADIYTWTDESGKVNVSNLTPPEGASIAKIVHETARPVPPPAAPPEGSPVPIEVQTLALRVRQLEYEVELAKRQPPPPAIDYAAYSPPMQYASPPMDYSVDAGPQTNYGCDQAWNGCFGTWGFGYPATVVVLGSSGFRRPGPIRRPHPYGMQKTTGAPWGGPTAGAPWGGGMMGSPSGGKVIGPPGGGGGRRR